MSFLQSRHSTDTDSRCMVLSAWMWGVVDASLDFCIGIASGNMSFMDAIARKTTTPPTESSPRYADAYRRTTSGSEPIEKGNPANKYRIDNETEYFDAPLEVEPNALVTPEPEEQPVRLPVGRLLYLIAYVILRLVIKTIALAGIQDYASRMGEGKDDEIHDHGAMQKSDGHREDGGPEGKDVQSLVPPEQPPPSFTPPYLQSAEASTRDKDNYGGPPAGFHFPQFQATPLRGHTI
ncbi:uncharacterized protein LOC135399705 isoform X2 [Ornithodoros turicata]|uniref:uncharacterized protein LOC135399705 isoform X2 n=1 Tax=Ornithodoros turicata TaxID=34597 RepID=UPI003139F817